MARLLLLVLAIICLGAAPPPPPPPPPPLVLAAASLREVMGDASAAWVRAGHRPPAVAFAASSALARQAGAGVGADLFVSADEAWMDVLARAGRLVPGSRADLAGNRLVAVARRGTGTVLRRATLARELSRGPLALADPEAVPAGRYARAALRSLGAWPAVAPRVVRAENVRAALALVERGAAAYGVVYSTDARASRAVRIVGVFPATSHPPIRYPIARLRAGRSPVEAEAFRRLLLSPEGRAILIRRGFTAA